MGASRDSLPWFRGLGANLIDGPGAVERFLEKLFRDLWQPLMVALGCLELRRLRRTLIENLRESEHPFSWSNFDPSE